ncbi:MAG: hypothetical protein N3E40_03435 [Dehalococcoidia bacterium]|nr:hypothetical protein [Dehalococcoidia bacterium]
MKLCVKRIYCVNCRRLVKCREEPVNGRINIVCSRCGSVIWVKNPVTWRYAAVNEARETDSGEAEAAQAIQQKQR